MRILISILILFSLPALAENWAAAQKAEVAASYNTKEMCEKAESAPCFEISNCKMSECSVIDGVLKRDPAKLAAKAAEEKNKGDKRAAAILKLQVCAGGSPTNAELARCVEILSKYVLGSGDI